MESLNFVKVGGVFEAFSKSTGKNKFIIRCIT